MLVVVYFQFLFPVPCMSGSGDEEIQLGADVRLSLEGDPVHSPVTFFIMKGSPPTVMFPIQAGDFSEAKSWQIQIRNTDGQKVSFIQGVGRPTAPVIFWSGLSEDGESLPDGFYEAQLVWFDAAGVYHESTKTKISLLTPPAVRDIVALHLRLSYTKEGLVVHLPEILLFDMGEYAVRPEAIPALKKVVAFLREYPNNKVLTRGFTDSVGTPGANKLLSQRRAQAVADFLALNGVDPDRLSYQGLGADQPIASNATAEGRSKNRRVEVVLLKAAI